MLSKSSRSLLVLLLLTLSVTTLWGQSAFWSPSQGTLQEGKANNVDLFFDGAEPQGQPSLPATPGLELRYRGTSNSTSIINGRVSAKTIFNYQAIPSQRGEVVIPSFTVQTASGPLQVPEARFQVVEATVGSTGVSPGEVFLSRFQISDETIYEGEVFEIDYYAGAKQEYQLVDLTDPEWDPTDLVTSGLKETQSGALDWQGDRYIAKAYRATAMATDSGYLEAPGAKQTATVVVGRRRDFLFQEPVYDAFNLESEPFSLQVEPLPDNAPPSFAGAVGQFNLESKVVPAEVQIGEPITWTLKLSGVGNWPTGIGVPARSVSNSFRAVQPSLRNEFEEGNLFSGAQTEDIVLIPTSEGEFQFGPISYTYFDTEEETYKTITIPQETVMVTASAAATSSTAATEPEDLEAEPSLAPAGASAALRSPALPRGPKSTQQARSIPQGRAYQDNLAPAVTGIAAAFCLWAALALTRSLRRDPRRSSRAALRELRRLAREPDPATREALLALQIRWRQAAVNYFALPSAEPTPDELERAARVRTNHELAEQWRQLWIQSDAILYGPRQESASDWQRAARSVANASPTPRYRPSLLFKRSNWLGAVAAISLLAALNPSDLRADDAAALYVSGEFAEAEALWRDAIDARPSVFEHRYNAGLAAAQQKAWGRAWGYWAGAFCLEPNNADLIWNLRLAHANTAAYEPTLQALLDQEGLYRVARLLSPAGWEKLSERSVWLFGAFLILAALCWYAAATRRLAPLFLTLAVLAILNSFFALWAASKYEALANPATLLVVEVSDLKSIPSDLSEEQIAAEIQEGSLAFPLKRFLGWTKVELANGEIGWMRSNKLLPLYGAVSDLKTQD